MTRHAPALYAFRCDSRALFAGLLLLFGGAAWAQEVGTVAEMDGSAEIKRGGVWTAATAGAAVQRNDELRTGAPGRLQVVFQDDSVITLTEGSHLIIDDQVFHPDSGTSHSFMRLLQGKVGALVSEYYHGQGAKYEIKTVTATAGVRGTDFVMQYDPHDGVTNVIGVSGRVEVHNAKDPTGPGVFVTARELTTVARGQAPASPHRLDDSLFRQYIEGLTFVGAGRLESLTVGHPLLAGAAVPHPDRAAPAQGPTVGNEGRDASSLLHQPPATLGGGGTGRLRVKLF
jgi:hypothetical protein